MIVKIELAGRELGRISYDAIPGALIFFHECGFHTKLNPEKNTLELISNLENKSITFLDRNHSAYHPFRNGDLERKLVLQMKRFLTFSEINITLSRESEQIMKFQPHGELFCKVNLLKSTTINKPNIEVSHNLKTKNKKWLLLMTQEFKELGIKFVSNQSIFDIPSFILIKISIPAIMEESFWKEYGENFALILSMGMLSNLQGDTSFFPLALMNNGLNWMNFKDSDKPIKAKTEQNDGNFQINEEKLNGKIIKTAAEASFNYHLVLSHQEQKKVTILSELKIKNTGIEPLRNPYICLRMKPLEGINVSGQILPPKAAQVLGINGEHGSKGWKFLSDQWYEEAKRSGEIWIAPIQQMIIEPYQEETLSNLQLNVHNIEEINQIAVQAFISFNDRKLNIEANNQISISIKQ